MSLLQAHAKTVAADNLFVAVLTPAACVALIAKIPQCAYKTLTLWRAVQIYDAQPAPTKEREYARPPCLPPAPRWKKIVKTCLTTSIVLILELAFPWSAVMDDGTRPVLGRIRDAVPATILAFFLTRIFDAVTLHRFPRTEWVHRAHKSEKNQALHVRTALSGLPKTKCTDLLRMAVLCVAFGIASWALQSSSAAVITLSCIACLEITLRAIVQPALDNVTYRGQVIGLCKAVLFLAAYMGISGASVVGVEYFGTTEQKSGSGADTGKTREPTESLKSFAEMMAIIVKDKAVVQTFGLFYVFAWSYTQVIAAHLITLAYRYDVSCADDSVAQPSASESEDALSISQQLALQEQTGLDKSHPLDHLGRYKVASNVTAARKDKLVSIPKPTFKAAMTALIVVELAGALLHFALVMSQGSMLQIPISREEAEARSSGVFPFTDMYLIHVIAYPVILVVMAACAWRQDGTSGLRRLWAYNECWKADYPGIPMALNDGESKTASPECQRDANEAADKEKVALLT